MKWLFVFVAGLVTACSDSDGREDGSVAGGSGGNSGSASSAAGSSGTAGSTGGTIIIGGSSNACTAGSSGAGGSSAGGQCTGSNWIESSFWGLLAEDSPERVACVETACEPQRAACYDDPTCECQALSLCDLDCTLTQDDPTLRNQCEGDCWRVHNCAVNAYNDFIACFASCTESM